METTLTYMQNGDYLIPDLALGEQIQAPLGKYGRMRRAYLKQAHPVLYSHLLLSGKLYSHLSEIEQTALRRMDCLMPQLMLAAGVSESLKETDQMQWIGLMNNCKAQAEEMILAELVYE